MGKQGLTRRGLTAAIAAALPLKSAIGSADHSVWAGLVRDLRIANGQWAAAMASLNKAERRYFALPARRRRAPQPVWYVAAQQAEAEAADQVERVHRQIARTRALGREGLALKMRLLAAAYGDTLDNNVGDAEDLVSCLIRSLVADLS